MFLNKDLREKGKTAPRAVEVINLEFASALNTSAYKVLLEKTGQILSLNQLEFDEGLFPYRKEELIAKLAEMDDEIDILNKVSAPILWIDPSLLLGTFKKVDMGSDHHLILQSPSDPNAYLKVDQEMFFKNLLATTSVHEKAMMVVAPLDSPGSKGSQTR